MILRRALPITVLVVLAGLGGWAYRAASSRIVLPPVNQPHRQLPPGADLASPKRPTPVTGLAPVPVCVRVFADDGLTLRFVDELNKVIEATPPLYLGGCSAPEPRIFVTVPTHLEWQDVEGRDLVTHTVAVEWTGKEVEGVYSASCWRDELAHCANAAVADALRVALAKR